MSAGEGLRALTYPTEAMRVLKLPVSWAQRDDFLKFIPYFLPRFIIDYRASETNSPQDETFEICTMNACEVKGVGFEEFVTILTPKQSEA